MPTPPNEEVIRRAKDARRKKRAAYAKEDARRAFTLFCASSAAESELYRLSNLSPAKCTITWEASPRKNDDAMKIPSFLIGRTCIYPTSEHAYQSLKCADYESAKQFEVGGRVSMEIFKEWPVATRIGIARHNTYDEKMKKWGKKGEGIAAKMISTLDHIVASAAFGIKFKAERSDVMVRRGMLMKKGPSKPGPTPAPLPVDPEKRRRHLLFLEAVHNKRHSVKAEFERIMQERMRDVELGVWGPILDAKFIQNSDARSVLIETKGDKLVERSRMPRHGDYWSGFVHEDGTVVGGNMMGRLLEHIRVHIIAENSESDSV